MNDYFTKHFKILLVLLAFPPSLFTQTINPQQLEKEITALNDQEKYDESILKLQKIIDNSASTHYDLYHAYLQKYQTYKKVTDFSSALLNLKKAGEEGLKSDHKEETKARVLVEDFFVKIELQNFKKARLLVSKIDSEANLRLLDFDTQGFYYCGLGILDILEHNATSAEKQLDSAIRIFEKRNPKHLANVYRIKMDLYREFGEENKNEAAYEKGLFYAKKYNIKVYEKGLYESMAQYYRLHYNREKVNFYTNLANSTSIDNYKTLMQSEKLKKIESDLQTEKERKQQYYFWLLIAIVILTSLLVLLFFKKWKTNHKKNVALKDEFDKMRTELDSILQRNKTEEHSWNEKIKELSERQLQILDLVKKGKTNKEIGQSLYISENTVKYHLKIIYGIMDIENRIQLQKTTLH